MESKILNEMQKSYDKQIYPIKSSKDKLICLICAGRYTRHAKCKHTKSKRHIDALKERTLN